MRICSSLWPSWGLGLGPCTWHVNHIHVLVHSVMCDFQHFVSKQSVILSFLKLCEGLEPSLKLGPLHLAEILDYQAVRWKIATPTSMSFYKAVLSFRNDCKLLTPAGTVSLTLRRISSGVLVMFCK